MAKNQKKQYFDYDTSIFDGSLYFEDCSQAKIDTDEFVEIAIVDTGRGIPADKVGKIFERFEQVESADASEKGGAGLGLAICKRIVERYKGRIWAESKPGIGSTFFVALEDPHHE